MNLKYFLILVASALLVHPVPSVGSPVQVAIESRRLRSGNDVYSLVNPAVVTVYAGKEIGSGSIVSADGLVITNYHVINEVRGGQLSVRTAAGDRFSGRVIATDRVHDLALIQLTGASGLPTVRFASDRIQPGEAVYAIGSPYGRPGVMTNGTFSNIRGNGDLQSRVLLRPGNSGGPLLNAQGELIGVNKAILESQRGTNTGISFATSASVTRSFVEQYRPSGAIATAPDAYPAPSYSTTRPGDVVLPPVLQPSVPYAPGDVIIDLPGQARTAPRQTNPYGTVPATPRLGVTIDTETLVIQRVEGGSLAAQSGLQVGDRLMAINGNPLAAFSDLQQFMQQPTRVARFTISRNGYAENVRVRF
jgi:S1-C subfamily serine protease